MSRPDLNRVPPFYHNYINQVHEEQLSQALQKHQIEALEFLNELPADKWTYRYAEDKWTIKELVQHIIDTERIFSYRALCFSRKDETSLPGFDENVYVQNSNANNRNVEELLAEMEIVQKSSIALLESFTEEQLEASGVANNNPIYVKAIGYILVGHTRHHLNIIKERYL
jgi:uncharacterized damage-inducible protein DinB